jgi:hypothetical protein
MALDPASKATKGLARSGPYRGFPFGSPAAPENRRRPGLFTRRRNKMKLELAIITAALVSTLLPACAQEKSLDEIDKRSNRLMFAEGLSKESFDRIVISGTKTQIGFFHSLNPDCTSSGDTVARITTQPEHGTVEVTTINSFAIYKKDNIRGKCNEHKVKGPAVFYKSADKYVGDDAIDMLIIFPKGFAWDLHVSLKVK